MNMQVLFATSKKSFGKFLGNGEQFSIRFAASVFASKVSLWHFCSTHGEFPKVFCVVLDLHSSDITWNWKGYIYIAQKNVKKIEIAGSTLFYLQQTGHNFGCGGPNSGLETVALPSQADRLPGIVTSS